MHWKQILISVLLVFGLLGFSGCNSQFAMNIADQLEQREHLVNAAVTIAVSLYLESNPEHATRMKEIAEAVRDSSSDTFENLLNLKEVVISYIDWNKLKPGQQIAVSTLIDLVIGELQHMAEKRNWGTPENVKVQVGKVMTYIASTAAIMETRTSF